MLDKAFPAINATKGPKRLLSERNNYEQAELGIHTCVDESNGERRRATENIGSDDCTGCRVIACLQTNSLETRAELSPTTSRKDDFHALLISIYGQTGSLDSRTEYLDEGQSRLVRLGWPERVITPGHSPILTGMHDLAKILTAQSKDEEAEELLRVTVSLMERELELDDPELMSSASSLALILVKRNKNAEAEVMYRKILKSRNKVLMWDDPDTEETLARLGVLLKSNGKLQEAAELTASYRLPDVIKSIMLSTFPRQLLGLHVGLIDDHYDDDDIRAFLESDTPAINEIRVSFQDESRAVELLLDPEDLRMVFVVSLRAMMGRGQDLRRAIQYCLEYGMGDWRDLGIDTFVCCVDEDDGGNVWALPHHQDS